jgi:hypothetical protein
MAYEALALDHRRAESTAAQLEREAAMREVALAARADEVASLHEATRAAHMQNNQYVMDLQVGGLRVGCSCFLSRIGHVPHELSRPNQKHLNSNPAGI